MVSQLFLRGVLWGAVVLVGASAVLAWRQRPRPGATAFAVTMLSATWWVGLSSLGLATTDPALRLLWVKVEWAGIVYVPVAWLAFALAYTGRGEYVTPRTLGLLAVLPTITLGLGVTNGAGHMLVFRSLEFERFGSLSLLHRTFGPWYWIHVAYSYVLLGIGTTLILQVVASKRFLYRGQATAILLVVTVPWVANLVYVAGYSPVPSFDPTPYAFVVSGAAGLAALSQLRFLEATPVTRRVARQAVIDSLEVGVLVLDDDNHVVELNPRGAEMLDVTRVGAIDTPADEILPIDVPPDGGLNIEGTTVVTVDHDGQLADYEIHETVLTDEHGYTTGHVVHLHDVTERRTRVQRLSVLNRVLRHNLRNEMNVIDGYAERLRIDETNTAAIANDIQNRTHELIDLSEKAREMDNILETSEGDPQPAALTKTLEIERARVADEYGVDLEIDAPTETVYVDRAVGTVLRNLIDNAVEHNPADDPWARVGVTVADEMLMLVVEDDGPGIPEAERTALDQDVETQLDHGSGMGLWLVRWGIASVGGSVTIKDRDPVGTRVVVTVPKREPPDEIES